MDSSLDRAILINLLNHFELHSFTDFKKGENFPPPQASNLHEEDQQN